MKEKPLCYTVVYRSKGTVKWYNACVFLDTIAAARRYIKSRNTTDYEFAIGKVELI